MNCTKCKNKITPLDCFPDGLCPDCYYKIMDKIPTHKLAKPDFIKAINKSK